MNSLEKTNHIVVPDSTPKPKKPKTKKPPKPKKIKTIPFTIIQQEVELSFN